GPVGRVRETNEALTARRLEELYDDREPLVSDALWDRRLLEQAGSAPRGGDGLCPRRALRGRGRHGATVGGERSRVGNDFVPISQLAGRRPDEARAGELA